MLVFPPAHMAKLAAATAPVFLVLLSGALRWFKAKLVEGLTAYLAKQHLQKELKGVWFTKGRKGKETHQLFLLKQSNMYEEFTSCCPLLAQRKQT